MSATTGPGRDTTARQPPPHYKAGRWRYLLQEIGIGLRRNMLMTVAVVLTVSVSLTLLGASLLLREQIDRAAGYWYGKIEVSIFLCDGRNCETITPDQHTSLRQDLASDPLVANVYYESKQEAYQRFKKLFRDQPDLVEATSPDALPASFRVKLDDPRQFAAIRDKYAARPGVDEIRDEREFLNSLFTVIDKFQFGALFLAVFVLISAGLLIANTIRLGAYARREQLAIMKLVGASNWYIRLPFVLEGAITGMAGALLAWGLLAVAVPQVRGALQTDVPLLAQLPFIGLPELLAVGPWLLLIGVVMAAGASFVALGRFLEV